MAGAGKMGSTKHKIQRGITHLEDLKVDEFIDIFCNFDQYEISEKVDGSNIQFGIDEIGFYTTREDFGGNRVYDASSYPVSFSTTFLRSAHLALEKNLPAMVSVGLQQGDRIEAEVLFGEFPNVVPYSSDINRIILLRSISGDTDVNSLRKVLIDNVVVVNLPAPCTLDGKNICVAPEQHRWSFSSTTVVNSEDIISNDLRDAITLELIKLKACTDEDKITQLKTKIKEMLLNNMVRHIKSEFGPELVNGGWIEGIVCRHRKTKKQFKVVDKQIFGVVKNFLWEIRNDLTEKPRSVNKVDSFIGQFLKELSESINHPTLGTTQAKRYLRKFGSTKEEIIANLAKDIKFVELCRMWDEFIKIYEQKLEDKLVQYRITRHKKAITVNLGDRTQTFTYNNEIDRRTLQVFSSLFLKLEQFKQGITNATCAEDLIVLLVADKI